jgi:hypothetical protein
MGGIDRKRKEGKERKGKEIEVGETTEAETKDRANGRETARESVCVQTEMNRELQREKERERESLKERSPNSLFYQLSPYDSSSSLTTQYHYKD